MTILEKHFAVKDKLYEMSKSRNQETLNQLSSAWFLTGI